MNQETRRTIKKECFMFKFFILLTLPGYLVLIDLPVARAVEQNKEVHTVILNTSFKKPKFNNSWLGTLTQKKIKKWGKTRGLFLVPDSGPVIDGLAVFVSKHGSEIIVTKLEKGFYRLWIDFVVFNKNRTVKVPSSLEIYIDKKLLKIIKFDKITPAKNPFILEIPYNCTVDGKIVIYFKENTSVEGFWGIWDIILSNSHSLPDLAQRYRNQKNKMTVSDRVVLPGNQIKKIRNKKKVSSNKYSHEKAKEKKKSNKTKKHVEKKHVKNSLEHKELKK